MRRFDSVARVNFNTMFSPPGPCCDQKAMAAPPSASSRQQHHTTEAFANILKRHFKLGGRHFGTDTDQSQYNLEDVLSPVLMLSSACLNALTRACMHVGIMIVRFDGRRCYQFRTCLILHQSASLLSSRTPVIAHNHGQALAKPASGRRTSRTRPTSACLR